MYQEYLEALKIHTFYPMVSNSEGLEYENMHFSPICRLWWHCWSKTHILGTSDLVQPLHFYYFFFDLGRLILVPGIYFLNFFLNPPNNQASSISDAVTMELADQLWFSFR